jgi:hypothetical protein
MKYGTLENLAAKLKADEPWFVVRAQDKYSVECVRAYAHRLYLEGDISGSDQVQSLADAFVQWQRINGCKIPD